MPVSINAFKKFPLSNPYRLWTKQLDFNKILVSTNDLFKFKLSLVKVADFVAV